MLSIWRCEEVYFNLDSRSGRYSPHETNTYIYIYTVYIFVASALGKPQQSCIDVLAGNKAVCPTSEACHYTAGPESRT